MNDNGFLAVVGAICVAACYVAYVTATHGDGVALAAASSAIASLLTGALAKEYGKRQGFTEGVILQFKKSNLEKGEP